MQELRRNGQSSRNERDKEDATAEENDGDVVTINRKNRKKPKQHELSTEVAVLPPKKRKNRDEGDDRPPPSEADQTQKKKKAKKDKKEKKQKKSAADSSNNGPVSPTKPKGKRGSEGILKEPRSSGKQLKRVSFSPKPQTKSIPAVPYTRNKWLW